MLLRFDPFRDLDRVADEAFRVGRSPAVPMDAVRKGEHVTIRFDLPGVDPATIDLEVERNQLTLKAERRWERAEDEEVLAAERRHGTFTRQLLLGDTLDGSQVEAAYADGVLTLTIPVAETAKPRKVAVATAAPELEAEAGEA